MEKEKRRTIHFWAVFIVGLLAMVAGVVGAIASLDGAYWAREQVRLIREQKEHLKPPVGSLQREEERMSLAPVVVSIVSSFISSCLFLALLVFIIRQRRERRRTLTTAHDAALEAAKKELQVVQKDNEVLRAQPRGLQILPEVPISISTPREPFGRIIAPLAIAQASGGTHSSFSGTVTVFTFQVGLGDRRNIDFIQTRGLQLELLEIREHLRRDGGDGNCGAVLRAGTAGGLVYGGEKTSKTDVNCYYVPFNTVQQTKEAYSIYLYYYADKYLSFVTLHVEHINPNTGLVTIRGCEAHAGL